MRKIDIDTRVVIGTDNGSSVLFELLRQRRPDVLRVLDASHPPPTAVRELLRKDAISLGLAPQSYDDYREPDHRADATAMKETELADRVLVASRFSAGLYEAAGVPRAKIRIVSYAAPQVAALEPRYLRPRDRLQLVFVGAISERKGISLLLHTMKEMERRGVPVDLDIVGRHAGAYRLPSALPSNVTFHGSVQKNELTRLISQSHLLILPSMCEGFGRVLLEALQLGTGLVSTTASGAPDLLDESPHAPIWIMTPESRKQLLPDLLEELTAKALAGEIDPRLAKAAALKHSLDHYMSALDAATSAQEVN